MLYRFASHCPATESLERRQLLAAAEASVISDEATTTVNTTINTGSVTSLQQSASGTAVPNTDGRIDIDLKRLTQNPMLFGLRITPLGNPSEF